MAEKQSSAAPLAAPVTDVVRPTFIREQVVLRAVNECYQALEGLTAEERQRVMRAVGVLFDIGVVR